MKPVHVSITVALPREEVFDYLADIANHPEFTDHYLVDWRLTREESYGRGAGARFRLKAPLNRFDGADVTLIEVEPPHRIVMAGGAGKLNRIRTLTSYTLDPAAGGQTEVGFEVDTKPVLPSDRLMEAIARPWFRRNAKKGLKRLRSILEEDVDRGARATIAGR
ncbi:MAG: SRPBCC family protein [Solirubrobacteraceae bacterium]